jgi:hypothetical protein
MARNGSQRQRELITGYFPGSSSVTVERPRLVVRAEAPGLEY